MNIICPLLCSVDPTAARPPRINEYIVIVTNFTTSFSKTNLLFLLVKKLACFRGNVYAIIQDLPYLVCRVSSTTSPPHGPIGRTLYYSQTKSIHQNANSKKDLARMPQCYTSRTCIYRRLFSMRTHAQQLPPQPPPSPQPIFDFLKSPPPPRREPLRPQYMRETAQQRTGTSIGSPHELCRSIYLSTPPGAAPSSPQKHGRQLTTTYSRRTSRYTQPAASQPAAPPRMFTYSYSS